MAKYVDIEPVIKRLTSVCVTDDSIGMGMQMGINRAIEIIGEARIVDAEEVIYGEAVPIRSNIAYDKTLIRMDRQCNRCGALINQKDSYCPGCGAKMVAAND